MDAPTYIIGHKNPDADAICSAIAYADFKSATEPGSSFVPARCGNTNARIDAILQRFGVPPPVFIGDVTPRVGDIMRREPHTVKTCATCSEALAVLDTHDIRALPVVSGEGRLEGQISIFDLGEFFIPRPQSPKEMRHVHASVADIVRSLGGELLTGADTDRIDELYVRIGAMDVASFGNTVTARGIPTAQSVIVVGDRLDIQRRALEMGVRLIVVTGDLPVSGEILAEAKRLGVCLARSALDSASTAWIARAATRVTRMIGKPSATFSSAEKVAAVRRRLAAAPSLLNCVVDDDGRLLGVFSKSDILKPVKTKLILVDHNELSQAVDGAGEVNIVEVVDHHRLGNPPTQAPILFINRPIGSTCSIVADMYFARGLKPSPAIAGVMMAGLISDTLLLQSPTTTPLDEELLNRLSDIAGITPRALADLIFNTGSVLTTGTPLAAITSDCKQYEEAGKTFSVSQIEEIGFRTFWRNADALLDALELYRAEHNLYFSCLLVTDIDTQNSLLLVKGAADFVSSVTYPQRAPEIFDLPGIVSRKKQLMPYLTGLLSPVTA